MATARFRVEVLVEFPKPRPRTNTGSTLEIQDLEQTGTTSHLHRANWVSLRDGFRAIWEQAPSRLSSLGIELD